MPWAPTPTAPKPNLPRFLHVPPGPAPGNVGGMLSGFRCLGALALTWGLAAVVPAQDPISYRRPSPPLAAIVDAPLPPFATISPDRRSLLLLHRREAPSIAELAQPELRLAGLRINPLTNGPSRAITYTGISLQPLDGAPARKFAGLPPDARIAHVEWSRDGRRLAFSLTRTNGIELWLGDTATLQAKRLTGPILNAALGDPLAWIDHRRIVVRCIPTGRGAAPGAPIVPIGPVVQENVGRRAPARTYEDLLTSPHDEALFEYYATSQIAEVTIDGAIERYPGTGLHTRFSPSPDGRYLLVETLHRPYSYLVTASRFPTRIEVFESGRPVHLVADLPLAEGTANTVRPGPRSVTWRADTPATLSWFRSLDRGDETDAKVARRDVWQTHAAPFTGEPVQQQMFEYRAQSITWGDDGLALVTETWTRTRQFRLWRVAPGQPGTAELLSERSSQDRFKDIGRPILQRHASGRLVLLRSPDGGRIYLTGAGATPEGERPFVDEFDLATRQARRLWQSAPPHFEEFVAFTDDTLIALVTRRESAREPANYHVRSLADGGLRAVTAFPNPYPQFADVHAEVIRYRRADGVALSGRLYLPPGYKPENGPLPTLLWAYPREFLTADAAEQAVATPERFARISPTMALPFVLAGYAVLDDPAMPIIGRDGKPPNDTYIEQLVASATAAVEELVRRGVTDPKRVAIAGHSYGAFMTANLLAHTRLFRAGIARSGAYNRTLTPFGFQSEQRTFWQAPEVYQAMSPFNYANKIKDPLLLIHGAADNNSGTFPIQSERFFNALRGHGATARFVLLPHESHGYRARESLLHMLWEMETWLDTYVKTPPAPAAPAKKAPQKKAAAPSQPDA